MILILFILSAKYIGQLDFDLNQLQFIQSDSFIKLRIPGWEITDEPGAPELPARIVKVGLPYRALIKSIEIIASEKKEMELNSIISYASPPVILSCKDMIKLFGKNRKIYESSKPYPERILYFKGTGTFDNHQICELVFIPFQYLPLTGKLIIYHSIKFAINYEDGNPQKARNGIVKKFVVNPEDIQIGTEIFDQKQIRYLIITESPMDTVFWRLAHWKTKKGIPAQVRNLNWIINNYPGEDNAARIRNYLKTLLDSGTVYVLLGGDVDYI
ncbi:MAG: C25 family cysteine peptidase, partial [candidate division WOR-3 bacterium]|nr:C25 family cysteine peptidase [candidate division WOR-3 bacterium]